MLHMPAELGEEFMEGLVEGVLVGGEIGDGGGQFDAVAAGVEAGGHAGEAEGDAIERGVAGEPVIGEERGDDPLGALRQEVVMGAEGVIGGGDKRRAGMSGAQWPVDGEDVIEEEIDEDR